MNVEYVSFDTRPARTEYLVRRFDRYLKGRILDVGCDRAILKDLLPGMDYTGVDISGSPNVRLDLEKSVRLPFDDRTFDCVICIDVLEHLDNFHQIFRELIRTCGRYLIISLPNCWVGARKPLGRGKGSFGHYGLPADPPADRHKWFFSLSEAKRFLKKQADRHPVSIEELHATEKPRPLPVRLARRIRYCRQEHYLNRYAHTLWAVLKREEN